MVRAAVTIVLLIGLCSRSPAVAASIADAWQGTRWGESAGALLAQLGPVAIVLPQPLDFGDSYVQIVRRDIAVGGVPLIAFYQMDKRTGGLKRIQLERPRHGVYPAAFRAVIGALEAAWGVPAHACDIAPGLSNGYQASAELDWRPDGLMVRAIFRDTTIEAHEGCPLGDLTAGPCGLTGQFLVRISPAGSDAGDCPGRRASRN